MGFDLFTATLNAGFDPFTMFLVAASTMMSRSRGRKQEKAQKAALEQQRGAQTQALAQSQSQAKHARQAEAKANKKKPDVSSLLSQERARAAQGPGATMLTGAGGVRPGSMLLGKQGSLMGGG